MALRTFSDYLKIKTGEPTNPYSEEIPKTSISADVEGDSDGVADLGSPGMGKKLSPLEPVKDKAEAEFSKNGKLKSQKESTEENKEILCEEHDKDSLHLSSIDGSKFSPSISEVSSYVAKMLNRFPHTADKLLREAKRQGSFKHLMVAAVEHPEFHDELAEHLGHKENGKKLARKLVKAMHGKHTTAKEHVAGFHESVDAPRSSDSGISMGGDFGGGVGMGMSGNMNPVSAGQPNPTTTTFGTPNAGGNTGASGFAPPPAMSQPPANENRLKMGHHNMIDEMAKYEPMSNYMKECMGY